MVYRRSRRSSSRRTKRSRSPRRGHRYSGVLSTEQRKTLFVRKFHIEMEKERLEKELAPVLRHIEHLESEPGREAELENELMVRNMIQFEILQKNQEVAAVRADMHVGVALEHPPRVVRPMIAEFIEAHNAYKDLFKNITVPGTREELNRLSELTSRLAAHIPYGEFMGYCGMCGSSLAWDNDIDKGGEAECAHCGQHYYYTKFVKYGDLRY